MSAVSTVPAELVKTRSRSYSCTLAVVTKCPVSQSTVPPEPASVPYCLDRPIILPRLGLISLCVYDTVDVP